MATDIQIASLALTRIGHEPVTSFSASGSKAQRWFDSNYDFIKSALLREHSWNFAVKRVALVAAPAPVNEYTNRYTLPTDFVKLIRVNGAAEAGYRLENGFLVTNESTATIEYIYDVAVASFDHQFVDLLASRLSAESAFYFTDNTELTKQAWEVYAQKLEAAKIADAKEAAPNGQIANLALLRLGPPAERSDPIGARERAARLIDANYEIIRKALLREHAWRFAMKRAVLTMDTINTITGIALADPPVVTSAGHGFANGDTVYIDGVIGMTQVNGLTFTAANVTANTFELSGVDATGYTAYSSAGSAYGYIAKEYTYRFELPSDCLRLLRINATEADDYRVEQGFIYTDEGEAHIEYIFDVTEESAFDAQFVDLFAQRLAAEVAPAYSQSANATQNAWNIYNEKLRMARTMDSRQGSPRNIEADVWLNARA